MFFANDAITLFASENWSTLIGQDSNGSQGIGHVSKNIHREGGSQPEWTAFLQIVIRPSNLF